MRADHREGCESLKTTDRHGFVDDYGDEFDGQVLSPPSSPCLVVRVEHSTLSSLAQNAIDRNTNEFFFNQPLFPAGTWG